MQAIRTQYSLKNVGWGTQGRCMSMQLFSMQQGIQVQARPPSFCHLEGQVMHCLSRATGPPAQLVASLRVQANDRASLGKGGPDAPLAVQRQAVRQAVFWIVGGNLPATAKFCTSEAAKASCS